MSVVMAFPLSIFHVIVKYKFIDSRYNSVCHIFIRKDEFLFSYCFIFVMKNLSVNIFPLHN